MNKKVQNIRKFTFRCGSKTDPVFSYKIVICFPVTNLNGLSVQASLQWLKTVTSEFEEVKQAIFLGPFLFTRDSVFFFLENGDS